MISSFIRPLSFTEILDDLVAQGGHEQDQALVPRSFSGALPSGWWHSLFAADTDVSVSPDSESAASFYAEETEDIGESIADMADEDLIAAELDLASAATLADLSQHARDGIR